MSFAISALSSSNLQDASPRKRRRRRVRRRKAVFGFGRHHRPMDREERKWLRVSVRANVRPLRRASKNRPAPPRVGLTPLEADVFDAVLSFANNKTGLCFPSQAAIAEKSKHSPSAVADALARLEETGWISWLRRIVWREFVDDGVSCRRSARASNSYSFRRKPGALDRPVTRADLKFQRPENLGAGAAGDETVWGYQEPVSRAGLDPPRDLRSPDIDPALDNHLLSILAASRALKGS